MSGIYEGLLESLCSSSNSELADSTGMDLIENEGPLEEDQKIVRDFEKQHRLKLPVTHQELTEILDSRLGQCTHTEPALTVYIQDLADRYDGLVYGLGFRMKSRDSLMRKILDKWRTTQEKAADTYASAGEHLDAIISKITDILRYTLVFPTDSYTDRVKDCLKDFGVAQVCRQACPKPAKACHMGNVALRLPNQPLSLALTDCRGRADRAVKAEELLAQARARRRYHLPSRLQLPTDSDSSLLRAVVCG